MRTLIEWAEEIHCPEIKRRYLHNIHQMSAVNWRQDLLGFGEGSTHPTLWKAIQEGFAWHTTTEQSPFWEAVKDNFEAYDEHDFLSTQISIETLLHLLPSPVQERRSTTTEQSEINIIAPESWDEIFQRFEYEKGISIFAVNEFRKWVVEKYQAPSGKLEIIF